MLCLFLWGRIMEAEGRWIMPKSARNPRLSQEEKNLENEKIRQKVAKDQLEEQARGQNMFAKENWPAYLLATFLPPIGIWYIWFKQDKHKLTKVSMVLWTILACMIMIEFAVIMSTQA